MLGLLATYTKFEMSWNDILYLTDSQIHCIYDVGCRKVSVALTKFDYFGD